MLTLVLQSCLAVWVFLNIVGKNYVNDSKVFVWHKP